QLEDSNPRDRLTASRVVVQPGDLGVVLSADDLVAAHAPLDRWNSGVLGAPRVSVTVLTGDLERPRVDQVTEENRLPGSVREPHQRLRLLRAEGRRGNRAKELDQWKSLGLAQKVDERRHHWREPFGRPAVSNDVDQELVGQRVHEASVGEVGGLGGESSGGGPIAPSGVSMADGAMSQVKRLARRDVADVGGRGGVRSCGSEDYPDETGRGGQRRDETEEESTPPHPTP